MIEIPLEEQKLTQLAILSRIDSFCSGKGIRYSLAFGSLLGAIRHQGYIPWDDDVDIMMLRRDYDLFISTYSDDETSLLSSNKNPQYVLPFAKVVDNHSILLEESTMKIPLGIYVDVFPVDNIPDDPELCGSFFRVKHFMNTLHDIKLLSFSSHRSLWKNALLAIGKALTIGISSITLTKYICNYSQKYKSLNCKRVAVFSPTDNRKRWIVDKTVFDEYIRVPFEGRLFSTIKDWDAYLNATYGNYMALPPIEQRVSHHSNKVFYK